MFRHQPSVRERLDSDPARADTGAAPHRRSTTQPHSLQHTRTLSSMRKAGEVLEGALGLGGPGSPRRSAQAAGGGTAAAAAGAPDWATSEHYPGQTSAPRTYPDDSAPTKQVAAADAYGFGVRPAPPLRRAHLRRSRQR